MVPIADLTALLTMPPLSTVGALAFIVIAGASINIYTQIGLICSWVLSQNTVF